MSGCRASSNGFNIRIRSNRQEGRDGCASGWVTLGSLSKYFPQQQIEAILRASGREGTRRRKLPTLELMYYLIALGLHASEGCRAVLRRVLLHRHELENEELERLCTDSAITQGRSR